MGIVGGGVAGLALAALLAQQGERVTVYEAGELGGKLGRLSLGGMTLSTGPSLFTFPEVWTAVLARLGEPDPLDLRALPGGLGPHHTPYGVVPLPVPATHPDHAAWQTYVSRVAPLRSAVVTLLTTPPGASRAFLAASAALGRVLGGHLTAWGWLSAQPLSPRLRHALAVHALNAGVPPQQASALTALLPALIAHDVAAPAGGMGALLDALVALCRARGVVLRPGTPVTAVGRGCLTLAGGEVARHTRLVSALDPARLRALRGQPAAGVPRRPSARTVSGLAIYAALPAPSRLPRTTVLTPGSYRDFAAALRALALPPDTLTLIHAEGRQLTVLLSVPPTGQPLALDHPWVRGQLARAQALTGQPLIGQQRLAGASVAALTPADYARWGAPGGAIYGAALPPWRSGPFHPQPRRLTGWLWQVGAGVHPGGGLPAVLGGALMTAQAMARAGSA